jgi:UDP-glucose 4-epimerase
VGGRLAAALLEDGHEVEVIDDLSSGHRANVPDGARLHELDLGTAETLPAGSFDAILHLAGQSSGEKSFDDPVRDLAANARSTVLLAEHALRNDIPVLVHASSMGVYGQTDGTPVPEGREPRPVSWYGASKLAAERALAVAADRGLRTVSLRMFSVYGPGQDLAELRQGMVSIYLAYLLKAGPLPVRGSLDRVRDLVFVDDVVDAWRAALERGAGPINIGTGTGTRIGELIAQLVELCGLPPDHPVREEGVTPGDQLTMVADPARAAEELGWSARTPLREGLGAMLAWARERG